MMELNRFKQLLESKMGNVKPLITENSLAKELYSKQVNIGQTIGSWFPNKFTQFKGVINDNEDQAIEYLKGTLWPPIAKKLKEIDDQLKLVYDTRLEYWLRLNNDHLKRIGTVEEFDDDFLHKMRGTSSWGDDFEIRLVEPFTNSLKSIPIDTDF